ncbi:MAG: 50S ribosomal protein L10 [Herpetosiphon sp.]
MPNKENVAAVNELKEKLSRASMMLVSEYKGLTVADFGALRTALRANNAEFVVSKNTLTRIAARDLGISGLDEFLGGPVTLLLAYGDPVATAKTLNTYVKASKSTINLRGGLLGKDRIAGGDLEQVASTPALEESLSRVMGGIQSPATRIASTLQGVARNMAYILSQVGEGKANASA